MKAGIAHPLFHQYYISANLYLNIYPSEYKEKEGEEEKFKDVDKVVPFIGKKFYGTDGFPDIN